MMYQYQPSTDTIAAVSTASGPGGIAIVRLSGCLSFDILGKLFSTTTGDDPRQWKANVLRFGLVKDAHGGIVDEALAVIMRAPKSYTAEDSAEIHVHGGPSAVRVTLDLCLRHGARLAEPGEFTRRAFMNGRIDLAQAEAVLDMVSARTELSLRAARRQLSGELSRELTAVRDVLMEEYSRIEAVLNFPEDDTDRGQLSRARTVINGGLQRILTLLSTAGSGVALREGVRMVICGKPNAGKSSLLNALLRSSRAIVTDVAGTTRDTLEESANLKGIPVNLVDTAGILEPRDKVEEEAVRRSQASIASADLVLLVLDCSRLLESVDEDMLSRVASLPLVIVLNKSDLPRVFGAEEVRARMPRAVIVDVSALTGNGVDALEETLVKVAVNGQMPDTNVLMVTNARHVEALRHAAAALEAGCEALDNGAPGEIVSDSLKSAVTRLDAITGRDIDADAIDYIFSAFCIGK